MTENHSVILAGGRHGGQEARGDYGAADHWVEVFRQARSVAAAAARRWLCARSRRQPGVALRSTLHVDSAVFVQSNRDLAARFAAGQRIDQGAKETGLPTGVTGFAFRGGQRV